MDSKVFAGVGQKLISFLVIIPTMNNIIHSCSGCSNDSF